MSIALIYGITLISAQGDKVAVFSKIITKTRTTSEKWSRKSSRNCVWMKPNIIMIIILMRI